MKRVRHEEAWVSALRSEYLSTRARSPKDAAALIDRYAETMKMDRSTLFRKIKVNICKRSPSEKAELSKREIDTCAHDVFTFAQKKTREGTPFSIVNAFEILQSQGKVPARITIDQIYKGIDRQGFKRIAQAIPKRWERKHALELVQIDYTVSKYFKNAGEGRVILHDTQRNTRKFTKEEDRVWLCHAIDDASRVTYGEYIYSPGESMELVHGFLMAAFGPKLLPIDEETGEEPLDFLYQGIPEAIYWDRSSSHESPVTLAGLEAMGVKVISGGNEFDALGNPTGRSNKKAHGKVERTNGIAKYKFEQKLAGRHPEGTIFSIKQLNDLYREFLRDRNRGDHPTREGTRWQYFEEKLGEFRYPDAAALSNFGRAFERTVRNRLINVGTNLHAIAPIFCPDNSTVQVIEEHGSYYLLQDGSRHLLVMQDMFSAKPAPRTERATDMLSGEDLRNRFKQELLELSNRKVSIQTLRDDPNYKDDLKYFCEHPQSVERIKSYAQEIVYKIQYPNLLYTQAPR